MALETVDEDWLAAPGRRRPVMLMTLSLAPLQQFAYTPQSDAARSRAAKRHPDRRHAVHKWLRTLIGIASLLIFGVVVTLGTVPTAHAQAAPAAQKKPKDNAEYDIFNEVIKDIQGNNSAKAVTDLDTWSQKYPESDYKDDRLYYYMQAYSKANPPQPAKVVDYGTQLVNKGLKNTFSDPQQGPTVILNVLYLLTATVPTLPNPTPDQIALGEKAAHDLLDYVPGFFAADKKP